MSEPEKSPLARLVWFMVFLAVAGSLFAGLHYFAIDIPAQKANPPMNYIPNDPGACAKCMALCSLQPWDSSCPNNCMQCD